jgi:predicted transcriptional regulator
MMEESWSMARPASRHPTELELAIMKILWRDGPSSVRHVRDALVNFRDLAYTSVMTVLSIMTRKRYVRRTKSAGSYVYSPVLTEESAASKMLHDMVDRVFDGSTVAVMQRLIETSDLDADELAQIRQLIQKKAKE